METSNKTAREIYQELKANPTRARFGFGEKAILVNVDPQKAYTRTDLFKTAYETDPQQMHYINELAKRFRALDWPVVWTHVAYMDSGEDCGIWARSYDGDYGALFIDFTCRGKAREVCRLSSPVLRSASKASVQVRVDSVFLGKATVDIRRRTGSTRCTPTKVRRLLQFFGKTSLKLLSDVASDKSPASLVSSVHKV